MRNRRRVATAGLGVGIALALASTPVSVQAVAVDVHGGTVSGAPLGVIVLSGVFDALSGVVTGVVDFFFSPFHPPVPIYPPGPPVYPPGPPVR
jgi:hypothetical protein